MPLPTPTPPPAEVIETEVAIDLALRQRCVGLPVLDTPLNRQHALQNAYEATLALACHLKRLLSLPPA